MLNIKSNKAVKTFLSQWGFLYLYKIYLKLNSKNYEKIIYTGYHCNSILSD